MKISDFLTEMPELLDTEDSELFRRQAHNHLDGISIDNNEINISGKFDYGSLSITNTRGNWILAKGTLSTYFSEFKKSTTYLMHKRGNSVDFYADIVDEGGVAIYQNEVAKAENSTMNAKDMFMGIAWAAASLGRKYVKSSDTQTIGGQKLWYKWLAMAQSLDLETGYFIVGEDDPKPLPEDENPEKWFKKVFDSTRMVPYFKLR